jgi:hypothetical protein
VPVVHQKFIKKAGIAFDDIATQIMGGEAFDAAQSGQSPNTLILIVSNIDHFAGIRERMLTASLFRVLGSIGNEGNPDRANELYAKLDWSTQSNGCFSIDSDPFSDREHRRLVRGQPNPMAAALSNVGEMKQVDARHIREWRSLPKEPQQTDKQAEAFPMQIKTNTNSLTTAQTHIKPSGVGCWVARDIGRDTDQPSGFWKGLALWSPQEIGTAVDRRS